MSYQFYKKWHFKLLMSAWVMMIGAWIINGLGFGIAGIVIAFIGLGLGIIGLVGLIGEANKKRQTPWSQNRYEKDLKFNREWMLGSTGNVYVSYKTPFYYDVSFGAELNWILNGFFRHYKGKSLDKGLAISNLFFDMFPEKKSGEAYYPGLEFNIKGGSGCEQRLAELDKRVREFEKKACQIFAEE